MSLISKLLLLCLLCCSLPAIAEDDSFELGVNIGGGTYTSAKEKNFKADQAYSTQSKWGHVGGNLEKNSKVIHHTNDQTLYKTGRWGMKEYRFDVPNGIFHITVYVTETHFSKPLERIFNIAIEDDVKLEYLDMAKQYGKYQAITKSFVKAVKDGQLNIAITPVKDQGKLNAIYIKKISPFVQTMPAPENVKAFAHDNRVGLKWNKAANEYVTGYYIYRSNSLNGPWTRLNNELLNNNTYIDITAQNGSTYFYRIEAIDIFGNRGQLSAPASATPIPFTQKTMPLCFNCGGTSITTTNGLTYAADQLYDAASGFGIIGGNSVSIDNKDLPLQFQSYCEGEGEYKFDLPNGLYTITLEFMEPSATRAGERVFNVLIESYPVLKNVDMFKQNGKLTPTEKTFITRIDDGILSIQLQKRFGHPIISGIKLAPASPTLPKPQTVKNVIAEAREDRLYITWDFNQSNDIIGYNIYKKDPQNSDFQKLNKSLIKNNIYRDNTISLNNKYDYKVTAVNAALQEGPASEPCSIIVNNMDENAFLDMIQKAGFKFFWEEADPETGLIKDNSVKDYVSVAGTGFGLSAMLIGAERGYKPKAEIEARVLSILKALNKSQKKYGILFHYLDFDGTPSRKGYENIASTIDTGLLFMGIITVAEYFGGKIKEEAEKLIAAADWKSFTSKSGHIYMSWKPNNPADITGSGFFEPPSWNYFTDESIICTLLAIAAPNPDYRLSPDYFYKWKRAMGRYVPIHEDYEPTEKFVYTWSGAAFTYQFAHCWINFKELGSDMPSKFNMNHVPAIDWYKNSVNAAIASRLYCIDRMEKFKTFGPNSWGPTACAVKSGYFVGGFLPRGLKFDDPGDGPIAPYGAGTSIMFLPELSIKAMKHYYSLKDKDGKRLTWQDEYEGGYGFWDSYNLDTGYVAEEVIAIDQGPLILAIENYRTGLIQKTFMKNKHIQEALKAIGFANAK